MALDKKSTHVRLPCEQDLQLAVLAQVLGKDKAELAAILLEKAIVGEFHAVKSTAANLKLLGIIRD